MYIKKFQSLIQSFSHKRYSHKEKNCILLKKRCFYAFAFRHRRHYDFRLSVSLSIRPKPEIPSFHLYMGPLVHPNVTVFVPNVRLSIRPDRFPGIFQGMHGGNGLKFCMLMYPDHFQNWLDHGHGLIFPPFRITLTWRNRSNLGLRNISRRTHGGNGLKFCMLMYPGNLQNWLNYSHWLLIF